MEVESDAAVIRRSLREPGAFAVVFDRHAPTISGYLLRRLERVRAEDALGEVFRIAFESRRRYELDRTSCLPWLYGIASNVVARSRRSELRRLRALERLGSTGGEGVDEALMVAGRVDAKAELAAVVRALRAMGSGERDVVVLCAWEGLSYEEVAAALAIPVGTVRSRLNRARRQIRELTGGRSEEVSNEPQAAPGRCTP